VPNATRHGPPWRAAWTSTAYFAMRPPPEVQSARGEDVRPMRNDEVVRFSLDTTNTISCPSCERDRHYGLSSSKPVDELPGGRKALRHPHQDAADRGR